MRSGCKAKNVHLRPTWHRLNKFKHLLLISHESPTIQHFLGWKHQKFAQNSLFFIKELSDLIKNSGRRCGRVWWSSMLDQFCSLYLFKCISGLTSTLLLHMHKVCVWTTFSPLDQSNSLLNLDLFEQFALFVIDYHSDSCVQLAETMLSSTPR